MVDLAEIYSDIQAQGVQLFAYPIGFSPAATLESEGEYGIFLDVTAPQPIAQLKHLLAHELGHCATGCTHHAGSPWDLIARHEYKANRWAYCRYMPVQEIRQALQSGYTEAWQLAEWFDLPEPFVAGALEYYQNALGIRFAP